MADPLYGVSTFVEVVEAGSFAAAAKRLHLSRSAVGKVIARLEHELGSHLFHRTTRSLNLTEDGQAYYEYCARALAELDSGRSLLEAGKREPAGRLRVTAPSLFGRCCVAPVLLRLIDTYPGLTLEMSLNDRPVDLQQEGFDLGVRIGSLPNSATLSARKLGTQNMVVCASPGFLNQHGRPRTVEELEGKMAIVYSRGGRRVPWRIRSADGGINEAAVRPRIEFDDVQTIADAAVASGGLAWLPFWLVQPYVLAGALEIVIDGEAVVAHEIHAIWPVARHLAPKTRAAIDILRTSLASYLITG